MAAWSSQVPDAMTALIAAFRAAPALTGVDVRDGPVVAASAALEAVLVGWTGQPADPLAADAGVNPEVLGDADDREQFTIRCAALVLNGQNDLAAARTRAYALAAACGAAIRADRRLAGTVGDSHLSRTRSGRNNPRRGRRHRRVHRHLRHLHRHLKGDPPFAPVRVRVRVHRAHPGAGQRQTGRRNRRVQLQRRPAANRSPPTAPPGT